MPAFLNSSRRTSKDKRFFFLLQVPAIWEEWAKAEMREAALRAGIIVKGYWTLFWGFMVIFAIFFHGITV